MTIARRLILLVSIPLLLLIGLGLYSRFELAKIDTQSQFVARDQIGSLVTLGSITRSLTELRLFLRGYLLEVDQARRKKARSDFEADRATFTQLLEKYADNLVTDDKDRRLLNDFTTLSGQYFAGADKILELADEGRRRDALTLVLGPQAQVGERLGGVLAEWSRYNEQLATSAGGNISESLQRFESRLLVATLVVLALSGLLGWLTFRRIAHPRPCAPDLRRSHRPRGICGGGPLQEGGRRNGGFGPLGRGPEAGRGGHGRTALGQDQRRQTHRRSAGRHLAGRIRPAPRYRASRPCSAAGSQRSTHMRPTPNA